MSNEKDRAVGTNHGESHPEEKAEKTSRSRRFRVIVPMIMILVVIVGAFGYYLNQKRRYIATDDAAIDADRVAVSAQMLGRITSLMADEGDEVQKGQVLIQLDDSDLRVRKIQADAALNLAEENISLADVNEKRAERDYERAQTQYQEGVITKEQFEHTQSGYEAAKVQTSIARAQSRVAAAQRDVVKTQLNNTTIISPMDGIVSKRWVLEGEVVQPGEEIFTLYDLKDVWVTANLEETKIGRLREGDRVQIKVDSYPGYDFSGRITRIGSNTAAQFSLIPPNNASGNFTKITQRIPVEISFDNTTFKGESPLRLLPGMSAYIKVKIR